MGRHRSILSLPTHPACTVRRFFTEPLAGLANGPGRSDVLRDLVDELLLAREGALVAEAVPELDPERTAVEVALEIEEERLDPALDAAVVRVDADRERGPEAPAVRAVERTATPA